MLIALRPSLRRTFHEKTEVIPGLTPSRLPHPSCSSTARVSPFIIPREESGVQTSNRKHSKDDGHAQNPARLTDHMEPASPSPENPLHAQDSDTSPGRELRAADPAGSPAARPGCVVTHGLPAGGASKAEATAVGNCVSPETGTCCFAFVFRCRSLGTLSRPSPAFPCVSSTLLCDSIRYI